MKARYPDTIENFEDVQLIYNPAVSKDTLFLSEDEDDDYIRLLEEVFGMDDVTPLETEQTVTADVEVPCYVHVAEDASWFCEGDDGGCEPIEVNLLVSKGSDDGFKLSQTAQDYFYDKAVERVESELNSMNKLVGCRRPSGPSESEIPAGLKRVGPGRYK